MDYGPPAQYCERKQAHDRAAARKAARELERRERLPMRAYHCPNCGLYHVAHAIPLKRPRDWRNDNV
jgi:ribosomal protein L32